MNVISRITCGILRGDSLGLLLNLEAESVDAIVTDPPYGLRFMGHEWDEGVPGAVFWERMLRCAKPGAFLAAFGGTRTFHRQVVAIESAGWEIRDCIMWIYGSGFPKGSTLKPAWEPITLARKRGDGKLNIEDSRVIGPKGDGVWGTSNATINRNRKFNGSPGMGEYRSQAVTTDDGQIARWPTNLLIGEDVARDLGDLSRFFYTPKASKRERSAGLPAGVVNTHPTVKPLALMRWIIGLVAPKRGFVLDPFAGSGSTGIAALQTGRSFLGFEKDSDSAKIARLRIQAAQRGEEF